MTATSLIDRLNRRHPKVIDLSLDRIQLLLDRLDHPEHKLPPAVHVAGTNGKGSVIAFLRAFAEAAGLKVHVYTSPHLIRFNERIRIAGNLIADNQLLELLEECEATAGDDPITFFEITTAIAYLAFSRTSADLALIETGLGGRLDATNVLDAPAVTALTPISLDHQGYLGNELSGIAGEKAAIMRPGVPCIVARQPDEAMQVIGRKADEIGAKLLVSGRDWSIERKGARMAVRTPGKLRDLPVPILAGDHQIDNAAQAIACLDSLGGFPVSDAAITKGLDGADWPGRLQRLTKGPLVDELPPGWEIWVDGGHNGAAGLALARQAARWKDRPLALMVGMLKSKEPRAFLEPLAPHVQLALAVKIPGEDGAWSAEDLARQATAAGMTALESGGPRPAVQGIPSRLDRPGRILICGSLYLAGEILKTHA
ncbi:MAG: bifunctional folylpolyglutamate synthase/dihydrofolate synthase [Rhodospirillales bacterium]|nr:bifunctional folylpolyglutamate synthase/dihydrofolate synthase [Rhodospirillales bacterium]